MRSVVLTALLQSGAEDVAERGAGVGRAVWATAPSLRDFQRLDETWSFRVFLSKAMTRASTFWPTEKRSGRCSSRSRLRSERLMKLIDVVVDEANLETAVTDRRDFAGDDRVLAQFARGCRSPTGSDGELLPATSECAPSRCRHREPAPSPMSPRLYSSITCSPDATSRGRRDGPFGPRRRRGR